MDVALEIKQHTETSENHKESRVAPLEIRRMPLCYCSNIAIGKMNNRLKASALDLLHGHLNLH